MPAESIPLYIVRELLALKIQQEPNFKGISLPNLQEATISQFADDTTLAI